MTYSAYSAYLLTYCLNNLHIIHNMHIVFILVIFYIFCIFCVHDSFQCLSLFIPLLLGPNPRAQLFTYHHIHPSPLFWLLYKKLQVSLLILFACQRVSSLSHPVETVADAVNTNVSHSDRVNPSALCLEKFSL